MANEQNLIPFTKNDPRRINKPKGTIHLSTRIKNMLNDPKFEQKLKDGTIIKGEPLEAILKVQIAKARGGDRFATEWLAKYGWGHKLDITSEYQSINIALVQYVGKNNDNNKQDTNKDTNTIQGTK